ncbi:MAG TPA: hypothetical protein VFT69_13910 [Pseudolabrys sp.]|jgi:hypothetical protein|nr:hypothetical protein [Pseudolabrys sp.]
MPNQTTALAFAPPAEALREPEYQALVSALSESARGRAFLAEHARRARAADTSALLAALDRIETLIRAQSTQAAAHLTRMELQALLDDLRAARPMVETSPLPAKAAQLASLLDLLASRLADVLTSVPEAIEKNDRAPERAAIPHASEVTQVRWIDAPPDPLVLEPHALTADSDERTEKTRPAPTDDARVSTREDDLRPRSSGSAGRSDALAFIMALSEEERIALFT